MKSGLLLLILSLFFFIHVKAETLNPCQEAGVSAFQVFGIGTWGWDDQCKLEPKNFHPEWLTVIHQIKEINFKTAKILGTTVQELFRTRKLNVFISLDPLGSLGSYVSADNGDLVIGEFAEFTGRYFNKKVYAHELIHWIAQQPGTSLNLKFGALSDHLLFRETIPDWISTLVTGISELGLSHNGQFKIPDCLKNVRIPIKITASAASFHFGASLESQLACCSAHAKQIHSHSSLESFCGTIQENSEIKNNIVPNTPEWKTAFNPEVCNNGDCDPHQFSSLLTPFLIEVQKLTLINLIPVFLNLANEFSDHPRLILKNLRLSLPKEKKAQFNILWEKYDPKFYD